MCEHLSVGFTSENPRPAYARRGEITSLLMETHKIYMDYAITIISTSDCYVSNTLVSPDEDLITIDAISFVPSTLLRPMPLSPPCRRMGL
jgi:hypothetical protein